MQGAEIPPAIENPQVIQIRPCPEVASSAATTEYDSLCADALRSEEILKNAHNCEGQKPFHLFAIIEDDAVANGAKVQPKRRHGRSDVGSKAGSGIHSQVSTSTIERSSIALPLHMPPATSMTVAGLAVLPPTRTMHAAW
jgi:hypothetical protein